MLQGGREMLEGGREMLQGGREMLEGGREMLEGGWQITKLQKGFKKAQNRKIFYSILSKFTTPVIPVIHSTSPLFIPRDEK